MVGLPIGVLNAIIALGVPAGPGAAAAVALADAAMAVTPALRLAVYSALSNTPNGQLPLATQNVLGVGGAAGAANV
jgi:hypothetical protein